MKLDQIKRILEGTLPQVDPLCRLDANETVAFARSLEHIFAKTYDIEYPEAIGRSLIPVDLSVPPGATSHTYRMFDHVGEAGIISSYADDIPLVDATGREYSKTIIGLATGFHVSIQDLRSAALMGMNLDERKATSARKLMERKLDALMASGDTTIGLTGFANDANVPTVTPSTGTWATATAAQIQADIEKLCKAVFDATDGLHGSPDNGTQLDLVMAPAQYSRIASLRIDSFNTDTVLNYVLKNNPFVKSIRPWHRLKTAGAGSVARIVAFHSDADVLSAIIPQEFEILPMQPKSLGYMVPCHMRYGGVVWRFPKGGAYMDGC